MEITKGQYIDALYIVEKYHQQVGIINIEKTYTSNKTKVKEWGRLDSCSVRLRRCLIEHHGDSYIEDLDYKSIMRTKELGRKAAEEFIDIISR
jgi:hypothetical protein